MLTVQNHIHISPTLGGSSEYAPDKLWKVRSGTREEIPRIFAAFDESLNASLQIHVLTNENGPVIKTDLKFQLRVDATATQTIWERRDDLKAMYGIPVKVVDTPHVNDGQDHTYHIRDMVITQIGTFKDSDPKLIRFYVDIYLTDNSI